MDDAMQSTEQQQNRKGALEVRLLPLMGANSSAHVTKDTEEVVLDQPSKQPGLDDLFFDMLFAAALSVYGNNVDLSQMHKVLIFASYFSLLWWAWWTVTLFDVRYRGRDPVGFSFQCGQRFLRCSLLVLWVAFATVTGEFARGSYVNFAKIFILSRVTLMGDYILVLLYSQWYVVPSCIEFEPRKSGKLSIRCCHFVMLAGTFVSMLFWIVTLYVESTGEEKLINSSVIGLWCTAIVIELATEVVVEIYGSQRDLAETPLVERLALFSLIIFGNGFENIGQSLNNISPGWRDWSHHGVLAGGWSSGTMVNAAASVFIVTLLFFGYFARAIREFVAHPARILLWSYLHVVLHVAAAVLVIGLGKVISFINTLNALLRLSYSPEQFLPNTTDWRDYIQHRLPGAFATSIPNVATITDHYDRAFVSMIVATISVQGAQIPDVVLSTAMVNSTFYFQNLTIPTPVATQLNNYGNLIQSVQSPDTLAEYVQNNVFQFHYAYLCPALFFVADCMLKVLQRSVGGISRMDKYFIASIVVRLVFAGILISVQIAYYSPGKDSFDSIINALVYMVVILSLEACIQVGLVSIRTLIKHFHAKQARIPS